MSRSLSGAFIVLLAMLAPVVPAIAAGDAQNISIGNDLKIPGDTLAAGAYSFSVEDRLADRAIVRITSADGSKHYLLLTVPNSKLTSDSVDHLAYFASKDNKQEALRAWKCSSCTAPLEFVYPKLEAVKLTDDSTAAVMAVDPSYDKLPANLSADDMRVVTLWLLAPERITADNVGEGVKAAKYAPDANSAPVATASSSPAPVSSTASSSDAATVNSPLPEASSQTSAVSATPARTEARNRLPKTASNTFLLGLCGFLTLTGALVLRMTRVQQ